MDNTKDPSQILTAVVQKLSLSSRLTDITQAVAEAARALTGADGATFVLRDGDRCYYADENAISPLWKGKRFPLQSCISGWSMMHHEVVVIKDIYKDSRVPHDAYRPTFVKSLCMVPIRAEDPIGAIGNYWAAEHTPDPEDIKVLQILANSAAVALENLELKGVLQQQNQVMETALHSMAHDLRNPVAAMTGIGELLKLHFDQNTDPTTASYINSLIETGKRASEQIEKMLALYRASHGTLVKQNFNLSEISQNILMNLRRQYPNQMLIADISPQMMGYGDQAMVYMLMENLLSNAMKYSSKKQQIRIRIGVGEIKQGLAHFFVQDNGDGFDQSEADKLFKPLSRLHSSSDFEGTGLGLASVARIVEIHGGKTWAEGKKSEGATFHFTLPATTLTSKELPN